MSRVQVGGTFCSWFAINIWYLGTHCMYIHKYIPIPYVLMNMCAGICTDMFLLTRVIMYARKSGERKTKANNYLHVTVFSTLVLSFRNVFITSVRPYSSLHSPHTYKPSDSIAESGQTQSRTRKRICFALSPSVSTVAKWTFLFSPLTNLPLAPHQTWRV